MNGMKPCPFCGSMSQTVKTVWKTWRFVACKCKAAGAPAKDDEGAIANWNTRAVTITEYATDKIADLQAENDRLRELVKAAWRCIHTGLCCFDCRTIAGGCTLKTAMRELGIEADE